MISNSGHDENGKYQGGKAGDLTGTEWRILEWYNRPWDVVLRHSDNTVRNKIVELAKEAAGNELIGYDQSQRYTFWEHLKASNYRPSKITVPCEADCSAGVAAIVKAVGYLLNIQELKDVSIYAYTGNLKDVLKKAGFKVLTESKYLTSDKYLLSGDILLKQGCHTAINLDTGKEAKVDTVVKGVPVSGTLKIVGTSTLNARSNPGTDNPITAQLYCGNLVNVIQKYNLNGTWWFLSSVGWFSGNYVEGLLYELTSNMSWIIHKGYSYKKSTIEDYCGKSYCIDKDGWIITPNRLNLDGSFK